MTKEYKYDIAFSLCKQDVKFARELIAQLNPSIRVFFYENNQEELIAQSGPETFGRVFNKEARIVVILSRKEWSESFYTDIERNAIIDRTSVRNEGYSFLMVIPMAPGEIPSWYPTTKIYADPQHWSIDRLASFIEFKLSDEGGAIKKLTLEDRYNNLQERIAAKKELVQKQLSADALDAVRNEINTIYQLVEGKIEVLKDNTLWATQRQTWPQPLPGAYFSLSGVILEVKVSAPDETRQKIVSCQDYVLRLALYISTSEVTNLWEEAKFNKPFRVTEYRFLYNGMQKGWSIPFRLDKGISANESQVLFRHKDPELMQNYMKYYDLKDPASSADIIDEGFQLLLALSSETIEKYI